MRRPGSSTSSKRHSLDCGGLGKVGAVSAHRWFVGLSQPRRGFALSQWLHVALTPASGLQDGGSLCPPPVKADNESCPLQQEGDFSSSIF